MAVDLVKVNVEIPFPNKRTAEVVYHVLRVDTEPKRSGVTKQLSVNDNLLSAQFSGPGARQLRVAVNGFFENVKLVTETIEFAGDPVSDIYDYFT